MRILYIGNKLSEHGYSPSGVETLGSKLTELTKVRSISNKKNKLARMTDMILTMIKSINEYELVLIDTFSGKALWYAIICSLLTIALNRKYILILRGGNLPESIKSKRTISTYILKHSLQNIVPSLYLHNQLNHFNIQSKYIPNFIEIQKYGFKKRSLCKPSLFWVRAFHKVYNPEMAILVLKELQKTYAEAKLCMVGPDKDGSMISCRKLVNKLELKDSVKITGLLSKEKWIDMSKKYDFFINTTNYDNQPVSVMEAMSLGLPIISTNAGGLKYLHEDGHDALIVNKNDFNAMAEKIKILLNTPKLVKTLTENARTKVETFDWNIIKMQWRELLEQTQ